MRLIASPHLDEQDEHAINRGYKERTTALRSVAQRSFHEIQNRIVEDRLDALSWLISSNRLDITLAIRLRPTGEYTRGIFHEKTGIFTDAYGNSVAFSGSSNETVGGLVENYEIIDVFWSWNDDQRRVAEKLERFDAMWNKDASGLELIDFTEIASEILKSYRRTPPPQSDPLATPTRDTDGIPRIPPSIQLRGYQIEVANGWFKSDGRGILKMATGSGKTITALSIASRLVNHVHLTCAIIVCPYKHLVTQWSRECAQFGMNPILAFGDKTKWYHHTSTEIIRQRESGHGRFLTIITTNSTFTKSHFQNQLPLLPRGTILIVDEVHNLGASKLRTALPQNVKLRLGLSATPERWFDDTGTDALANYFGPVVQPEFTLRDALESKALCPYLYFPILVELNDSEHEQYHELSQRIARVASFSETDEPSEKMKQLLIKRSRLVGNAHNKLAALRDLMSKRQESTHMLFYCSDGVFTPDGSDSPRRQIHKVTQLLGIELGISVGTYTANESLPEREELRTRFESGELQGLVAIRCLDEGVDIPEVKTAFILASSTNPRQFIQRRGRILRRAPNKKIAEIYDFIVTPPPDCCESAVERNLLRQQLVRFSEFAKLAVNHGASRSKLWPLQRKYGLMDL